MPTGYTETLMKKGETFQQFAMRCARAFGALIMMRDDPMSTPIPEKFEASDYYTNKLKEDKDRLCELLSMTNEQRIGYSKQAMEKRVEMLRGMRDKDEKQNARIDAMQRDVEKWNPPTEDHIGMKDFMLDQLRISRNNPDCSREIEKALLETPVGFYAAEVSELERSIKYGEGELKSEIERAAQRTEWVVKLRKSLGC